MSTKRILIVEDEGVSRAALADLLREEGYHVDTAVCVADALAACGQQEVQPIPGDLPDLAIVDRKLPDGDGMTVVEALRTHQPPRPAIVVSGSAELQVTADGGVEFLDPERVALDAGVAYHPKPIDFGTLLDLIRRLV